MIFFLALLPATMLTMVGYAVLYIANRSEGGFKNLGKYLGFWAFTLAALVLLASLICASRGGPMRHMHMMMHGHGDDMQWQQGPHWREPPPPGMAPPADEPPAAAPHAAPGATPASPPAQK